MSDEPADGENPGGDDAAASAGAAPTTPRVDLALHGITVSVTGRAEDELDSVEESAMSLMDYLVEKSEELEDDHDEYGLS
jgi:hypothetical protein